MPNLTQQSADVRISEIDMSQTIASNSSSNAAIVLVSAKGRLNPFYVTNAQDFLTEYGYPNAAISFGHYSALDFFNEGSSLQVVRVAGSGYKYAACLLKDSGLGVSSLNSITGGLSDPANIDWTVYTAGAQIPLLMFTPKSGPGSYANSLAIKILSDNLAVPAAPTLVTNVLGGTLTSATYQYQISAISNIGETLASSVTTVVVGGSVTTAQIQVSWAAVPSAIGYNVYGRVSGNMYLIATVGATTLTFADTGVITPNVAHPPITNPALLTAPAKEFTVQIFDMSYNTSVPKETFVCTLQDATNASGVQTEATQLINPYSSLVNVESYVPLVTGAIPAVLACAQTYLVGGNSGAAPTNGAISLAWTNNFSDPEKISVNILINGGYTDVGVQQTMLSLAESRGDAFAILDTPSTMQGAQDAITYRQLTLNANSSYGAIYSSDNLENDNYSGKKLYVPPSGWVAAIFARTDRVAGPQFAPAGLNRGLINVLALRDIYNAQQRTNLFNAQVNYTRNFIGAGNAIFEQVTLQAKQSALSWVNVRRMVNVIKAATRDFLMYSLHEPNDDFTRKQIVSSLGTYLQSWKDARGISNYQVISDATNNPASQYNLGILTVTVFITPIIAVHEIQVQMVITKAGLSCSEINLANLAS